MLEATNVLIALVVLILAVIANIVVMARWSGKVDAMQSATIVQQEGLSKIVESRFADTTREIEKLRERQHKLDGEQQRQRGVLQWLEKGRGMVEDG